MALTLQTGFNLTPKQRAFANAYIETGSAPEAAMRAYDCSNRNSARVMAHRNLNNAKVQAYLSFQVTDTVLVDKGIKALKDGLDATKFIKLGKGKVMQVPDNQARLKAAMFYLKLVMNLPTGSETASASDDDYWEVWYMQEHGDSSHRIIAEPKTLTVNGIIDFNLHNSLVLRKTVAKVEKREFQVKLAV